MPTKAGTVKRAKKAVPAEIVARVRELLSYDPETGLFRWKIGRGPRVAGSIAGAVKSEGYREICIDGRLYYAHRLAWLMIYGRWPADQIDHANGDPSDNRICNLRECTNAENCQNLGRRKNNTSGLTGVHWSRVRRKWVAQIRDGGKIRPLGRFATKEEAHAAFLHAKAIAHKFQPTPRGM